MSNCPICNGQKESSTITFSVDLGDTIVIVRNTPATVCSLCGEEWIEDAIAHDLEEVINEAQNKHRMIEVVDFVLESVA
ncbi:MAG: type II toxin-antitoxin system MqsA family antitoxin [Campylobacterales bacterium]|nr:type II toxin-antitoxin system MqsA family antitoxin [Campylobacterales bacterium]